jgi:hypothetical protein
MIDAADRGRKSAWDNGRDCKKGENRRSEHIEKEVEDGNLRGKKPMEWVNQWWIPPGKDG